MDKEKIYKYETKCRKCNSICEWVGGYEKNTTVGDWVKYMLEKITFASTYNCETCKGQTVHDVVAFESNPS